MKLDEEFAELFDSADDETTMFPDEYDLEDNNDDQFEYLNDTEDYSLDDIENKYGSEWRQYSGGTPDNKISPELVRQYYEQSDEDIFDDDILQEAIFQITNPEGKKGKVDDPMKGLSFMSKNPGSEMVTLSEGKIKLTEREITSGQLAGTYQLLDNGSLFGEPFAADPATDISARKRILGFLMSKKGRGVKFLKENNSIFEKIYQLNESKHFIEDRHLKCDKCGHDCNPHEVSVVCDQCAGRMGIYDKLTEGFFSDQKLVNKMRNYNSWNDFFNYICEDCTSAREIIDLERKFKPLWDKIRKPSLKEGGPRVNIDYEGIAHQICLIKDAVKRQEAVDKLFNLIKDKNTEAAAKEAKRVEKAAKQTVNAAEEIGNQLKI